MVKGRRAGASVGHMSKFFFFVVFFCIFVFKSIASDKVLFSVQISLLNLHVNICCGYLAGHF